MLDSIPVRLRLTLWYLLIIFLSLSACFVATFFSLRRAVEMTVDDQLQGRADRIVQVVQQQSSSTFDQLMETDEAARLSTRDGTILFESPLMAKLSIPADFSHMAHHYRHHRDWGGYTTYYHRDGDVRVLALDVSVGGSPCKLQVAAVVSPFYDILRLFGRATMISVPLILLLAGLGGYWLSGRSMAPIRHLVLETHAITERNLGTQLSVPVANDELRELTLTVNAMLSRLNTAFTTIIRFTADASHELRTPVAVIRSTTELLLTRERSHVEQRELLHRILQQAEASSSLVEQLLTVARADAEEAIPLCRTDLRGVLLDVDASARALAEASSLSIGFDIPEEPVFALGNAHHLRRLLLTLIENACCYTEAGGSVQVRLESRNGRAVFEVIDNGIGICAEDHARIFDRFYRAANARVLRPDGNGLGLSIAKWVTRNHLGTISVESSEGRGTKISANLPQLREF